MFERGSVGVVHLFRDQSGVSFNSKVVDVIGDMGICES